MRDLEASDKAGEGLSIGDKRQDIPSVFEEIYRRLQALVFVEDRAVIFVPDHTGFGLVEGVPDHDDIVERKPGDLDEINEIQICHTASLFGVDQFKFLLCRVRALLRWG